jgi:predicted  nucleic acid-binding Zn-ribbon protein
MLPAIQQLLILQDRDRKITQLQAELGTVAPQRQGVHARADMARADLEAGKLKIKHLESDRKKLELDAEAKQQLIEKYSLQQFQTKKNEEYRALTHEIQTCKDEISKLEDEQLELMEQADAAHKAMLETTQRADQIKAESEKYLRDLEEREKNLQRHLADSLAGRAELAAAVDAAVLNRYERLRKSKGDHVVAGVEHGACGGCHMRLPTQIVVSCQGAQEVVTCPNCGRLLYYAPGMDLVAAE